MFCFVQKANKIFFFTFSLFHLPFVPEVLFDFCLDWFIAFLLCLKTMKMAELQKTSISKTTTKVTWNLTKCYKIFLFFPSFIYRLFPKYYSTFASTDSSLFCSASRQWKWPNCRRRERWGGWRPSGSGWTRSCSSGCTTRRGPSPTRRLRRGSGCHAKWTKIHRNGYC
jgi:hypothetical protein